MMFSCSSCLCSFIFTGPVRICDVTVSHTCIISSFWSFRLFLSCFVSAVSFRWFCFGHFGGFVSLFWVLVHAANLSRKIAACAPVLLETNIYFFELVKKERLAYVLKRCFVIAFHCTRRLDDSQQKGF